MAYKRKTAGYKWSRTDMEGNKGNGGWSGNSARKGAKAPKTANLGIPEGEAPGSASQPGWTSGAGFKPISPGPYAPKKKTGANQQAKADARRKKGSVNGHWGAVKRAARRVSGR